MRTVRLAAAVATALTLAATPALAGYYEVGIPPIGFVFAPNDQAAPVYITTQGPVITGPGVYADRVIKVRPYPDDYAVVTPHAYPTPFPYVRHVPDVRVFSPPYGIAPYAISVYWPAPRPGYRHARIRHVR